MRPARWRFADGFSTALPGATASPPTSGSNAPGSRARFRRNSFFLFERVPALELLHEQRLDLDASRAVGAQSFGALPEVVGPAHFGGERVLLGLERLDLARQRFELARFP